MTTTPTASKKAAPDHKKNVQKKSQLANKPSRPKSKSMALPRILGNASYGSVQAKLKIGAPNDRFEQEADRVADEVMCVSKVNAVHDKKTATRNGARLAEVGPARKSQPATPVDHSKMPDTVNRQSIKPEEEAIPDEAEREPGRLKVAAVGADEPPKDHTSSFYAVVGPGRPLATSALEFLEPRFGHPLRDVRVHNDTRAAAAAQSLQATAFTCGRSIVFGANQYAPDTNAGRRLLAHELAHVIQQSGHSPANGAGIRANGIYGRLTRNRNSGVPRIQRQEKEPEATIDEPDIADIKINEEIPDENPRHRRIDYFEATYNNQKWFKLLGLDQANPLIPFDPFHQPNAFINRVVTWQAKVNKLHGNVSFAQLIFAAQSAQQNVERGDVTTILQGIPEAQQSIRDGTFKPGSGLGVDGVLGPRTYWTMLVALGMDRTKEGPNLLKAIGIPVEMLTPLADLDPVKLNAAWRAVHAYVFTKPRFRATWSTTVRADLLIQTFEKLHKLSDGNRDLLQELFFQGRKQETVEIGDADLLAILARGYAGDTLNAVAALLEVDRNYVHAVDIERLLLKSQPKWRDELNFRLMQVPWERANFVVEQLGLHIPQGRAAQQAHERLREQRSAKLDSISALADDGKPLVALAIVALLPQKSQEFWRSVADQYVMEKGFLAKAADEATQQHLAELEKRFQKRMRGKPDISKKDAMAFLQLLVGDTFSAAQKERFQKHAKEGKGYSIKFISRFQEAKQAANAKRLLELARKEKYLIVQLGDDREGRFPLSLQQIEQSRNNGAKNGKEPLPFDMIDTPHAAMHMYTPRRFTARATKDGGSEAAENPYQLKEKRPRAYENWEYRSIREFAPFDPVLVEIREFNPEAGQLVRGYRQIAGTDKIFLRYVWTLGGSLTDLNKQLWDAQGKINFFGWIDAILTIGALATVVAAPFIGAGEAFFGTAATQFGRQAVTAAARRALYVALRRFILSEAIGEALGRATFYINDDESVPDELKTAWNGLMVALLIYGVGSTVRQGIKSFRNRGSVQFRKQLELLEAEIDKEIKAGRGKASAAESAALVEVSKSTAKRHAELVKNAGGEPTTGAARVRSDDPRAASVSAEPKARTTPNAKENKLLRKALGDDAADALEKSVKDIIRLRLAAIGDLDAIKKLHEVLTPRQLTRFLNNVHPAILRRFASALDGPALQTVLKALAGKAHGVSLLKSFTPDPARLAKLLDGLGEKTLLQLADNPGAQRFWQLASKVDPLAVTDALKRMGIRGRGSLARFRNLLRDVGPELTAQILNTYTAGEIRGLWRRSGGLSATQNMGRLAIKRRGKPTKRRVKGGIPVPEQPQSRPRRFLPDHFKSFFAVGPEATAPAIVRSTLKKIQEATAKAANHLDEIIDRANKGVLTKFDKEAIPPIARKTVEAFLRTTPKDGNHKALYGSALQYLAEAALRDAKGNLPAGLALRRREIRHGKTLIPDAQVQLTLKADLRFPKKNKEERAIFDWTTHGQAGKITKYTGGDPPATFGVEIIQPGPPKITPQGSVLIKPSMPTASPETETERKGKSDE